MARVPAGFAEAGEQAVTGAAESRSSRPVASRVLLHSSGFRLSPYADVRPAGEETRQVARKLWHRSPGSPG
jgi:error-prone DNA polymerase